MDLNRFPVRSVLSFLCILAFLALTGDNLNESTSRFHDSLHRAYLSSPPSAGGWYCRHHQWFFNRDRYVEGAPWDAECSPSLHTPIWGAWGVMSNVGLAYDGEQFRGWCEPDTACIDAGRQWNSCKKDYPPPASGYYNANSFTEQQTVYGSDQYAYLITDIPANALGCNIVDGQPLTIEDNWLDTYELDDPGDNIFTGRLEFPDLTVMRNCSYDACDPAQTSWNAPTARYGAYDDIDGEIMMTMEAELVYKEDPLITLPEESGYRSDPRVRLASLEFERSSKSVWKPVLATMEPPKPAPTRLYNPRSSIATGDLEVRVATAEAGTPIAGVTLLWVEQRPGQTLVRTVRTDGAGRAQLAGVIKGNVELLALHEHFGGTRVLAEVEDATSNPVTINVRKAGAVAGIVRDADGRPVGDAKITTRYERAFTQAHSGVARIVEGNWNSGKLVTSDDGRFAIHAVSSLMSFVITASHSEHGRVSAGPFSVLPNERLDGLEIQYNRD